MQTLKLRQSYKYQDPWNYNDTWKEVGEYEVIQSQKWVQVTEDMTEPMKQHYWVKVHPNLGVTDSEVRMALIDTFSHVGCHHDYDCCGCRSFYASNPEHLASDVDWEEWKVTVNSMRNY